MSIAEKLQTIAENEQRVYEAGKQAEYDRFWDAYQKNGTEMNYQCSFAHGRFTDETYNPKYPINVLQSTTGMDMAFYNCGLTDLKVPIYAGKVKRLSQTFDTSPTLVTIPLLQIGEQCTFYNPFLNCQNLKNITIEGTIGQTGLSFQWCPLTKASIESVINALSTTTTGMTITLKKTAVNAAFTTDEWNALVATKSNWTITLA